MSSPPVKYTRQADFSDFSTHHPGEQQPGVDLDNEFDRIKTVTDKTIDRLGEIQRDDGQLRNRIVTVDSLNPSVKAYLNIPTPLPTISYLTPEQFGAVRDGVTDDSDALQAVYDAAASLATPSWGGVRVILAAGVYRITRPINVYKSFVHTAGVEAQGTTIFNDSGDNHAFIIDGGTSGIRFITFEKLCVVGNNLTGGAAFRVIGGVFSLKFHRMTIENAWDAFHITAGSNAIYFSDVIAVAKNHGVNAYAYSADGADRIDVIAFRNVVLTGQWSDMTGLYVDGNVNTIVGSGLRILQGEYGIRIRNTNNSTSYFPQFINLQDVECEGFKKASLLIEAGADFRFSDSDFNNSTGRHVQQGSADTNAVRIQADTGGSYTRGVQFVNTRIGICREEGFYCAAKHCSLSNITFATVSQAGAGLFPAMRAAAPCEGLMISNVVCNEFGSPVSASYGLNIDSGTVGVSVTNLYAHGVVTAAVNNQSSDPRISIINAVEPSGKVSGLHSVGNNEMNFRKETSGGATVFKVYNPIATNNAQARFDYVTGVANAYVTTGINNGVGDPTYIFSTGPALSSASFYSKKIHLTYTDGTPMFIADGVNSVNTERANEYYRYAKNGTTLRQSHTSALNDMRADEHVFKKNDGTLLMKVGGSQAIYADDTAAAAGGVMVGSDYVRVTGERAVRLS